MPRKLHPRLESLQPYIYSNCKLWTLHNPRRATRPLVRVSCNISEGVAIRRHWKQGRIHLPLLYIHYDPDGRADSDSNRIKSREDPWMPCRRRCCGQARQRVSRSSWTRPSLARDNIALTSKTSFRLGHLANIATGHYDALMAPSFAGPRLRVRDSSRP